MTPDQMAELAARLRKLAKNYRFGFPKDIMTPHADDIDAAADLIQSMAQRVPLSDEEIWALWQFPADLSWKESVIRLAHAVEQAHGIRSEK